MGNQDLVHGNFFEMWHGEFRHPRLVEIYDAQFSWSRMIMVPASASAHDVVVSHGQITFEKKVIIFWIEDSLINVIAGERSDAVVRIPK